MKLITSQRYKIPEIEITEDGIRAYCRKEDIHKILDFIKGKKDELNGR